MIQYKLKARQCEINQHANCVTAVRFVLESAGLRIPRVWIGDLPAALAHYHWRALSISIDQLHAGDLLFVKREDRLAHLALAVDKQRIFHCTYGRGAVIDETRFFLKNYLVPFQNSFELLSYRDQRCYFSGQKSSFWS